MLLIDTMNKDNLLTRFKERRVTEFESFLQVEKGEFDPEASRARTKRDIFKELEEGYEWIGEMNFDHRIYSLVELKEILERMGFSEVDVYGNLDGDEISLDSKRLIVGGEIFDFKS